MKDKKNPFIKLLTYLFLIGAAIILYSHFFGTKGLEIREYAITNDNIPLSYDGFKIVHFSDLHYGTTIKDNEMKHLIKTINELKPDLVVFTGDLIDRNYQINDENIEKLASELNEIEASLGKYIITGNHDKNPGYSKVLEKIDYTFLDNKNEFIYYKGNTPIILVGLADNLEFDMKIDEAFNYENENGYYTILLLHEPDIIDMLKDKKIDLVLSGHSHNGQVRLPFIGKIYTPIGSKKYYDEKYELDNTMMYISGGLGTSMAEFRFMCKPSFNFYRLYTN